MNFVRLLHAWKGVARNPCEPECGFLYISKDFISAFLPEKWVTYLEKHAVRFQGTVFVKFIELYGLMHVLPKGENMKVLRLKTHFST